MDDEVTTPTAQETPAADQRGNRWQVLRERRKEANENRTAGEWLDWATSTATTAGTYALIGMGFTASYDTIRGIARKRGHFGDTMSNIVPLSFEGGIIILSLHVIREARKGRRAPILRTLVALGALATLITNFSANSTDLAGQLTHVVPVAMFIVCFEYLVHSVRRKALEDMGLVPPPMPSLRTVEWLLNFGDTFSRWRLMALHNIDSPDQAMWAHEQFLVKKAELTADKKWSQVPKHIRLRTRTEILAEAEARFQGKGQGGGEEPGRYTVLMQQMSKPVLPPTRQDDRPAPRKELQNPGEHTALPVGKNTVPEPAGDEPYAMTTDVLSTVDQAVAAPTVPAQQHTEPTSAVETRREREEREDREEEERDATYRRTVELVFSALAAGEPITGPDLAKHHTVGVRTVQRHLNRMDDEGLLPKETLSR
ncbi:DUF2637 domain-containing protein [Streptomyces lunalinharesii]|uniref:DUF2637 domain-containing protein n=1 Tax=Streptomyces lunalinharesii TaxID=333384 RepID=A0ABN3SWF1_9ACTN